MRAPSSGEWLSAGESPRFLDSWNIDPKSNYEFPFALIIPYGELRQAIYREWFVNFRFPGHENVKLVDSPTGQIPEGWEVGVVNDLLKLLSGFAFKSKTFVDDGGYKVVTIKHVHDGEFQTNSMSLLDSPPDRMPAHCHLETADVLMSLTGNIGRSCLVFGENFLLNRSRSQSLHRGLL